MTDADHGDILDQAIRWHAMIADADMDWHAFATWLDAAPEHQVVYDRFVMFDDQINILRDEVRALVPANDTSDQNEYSAHISKPAAWRWWAAGCVAAALIIAVTTIRDLSPSSTMLAYATGPGETRTVMLQDGSSISLDRNTRLAVADLGARRVRLDQGAAFFHVLHDPARTFIVASGEFNVRDLGTQFSIARHDAQISVAVSQGLVNVQYRNNPAQSLDAGRQLDSVGKDGTVEMRRIDPASVASWREGRLVYDNTPLSVIARDMSRYTSRLVSVEPQIADVRFSGVLIIGDGSHLVDQLQSLLPVSAEDVDGGVKLVGTRRHR